VSGVAAQKKSTRDEPVTLTDPAAIKALAHPARLAVLEELQNGQVRTATECAEIAGLSASAMSYHLRALERWGFIERAGDSGDGRERPWRARSTGGWRIEAAMGPVGTAATSAVLSTVFERMRNEMLAWTEIERDQPEEWQSASAVGNHSTWLTAAETREIIENFQTLMDGFKLRTAEDHPDGARRVRVGLVAVPTTQN
jgi:DNA-binding transcriptional ArsR family regulator